MRTFALTFMLSIFAIGAEVSLLGSALAQTRIADDEKGQKIFIRCRACHNLTASRTQKLGPSLENIFGRKAGTANGFNQYSKTMKNADFIWDVATLDQYLSEPRTFLPGNNMAFAGVRNAIDRKNLILYLQKATRAK
jgi:cytochrome c